MILNIKPINEVYIGKTKELLEIEKQLDKFRNKYMGQYLLKSKVNSDPDLIKLNRMFESYFGIGCFMLGIESERAVNAYTISIDNNFDVNRKGKDIIVDKNGYRFKKEYDYSMCIATYTGVLFNPDFETDECMAMILHEIGHNFFRCMSGYNCIMSNVFTALKATVIIATMIACPAYGTTIAIPYLLTNTNAFMKFVNKIELKLRENNSVLISLSDTLDDISGIIETGKTAANDIIRILCRGLAYYPMIPSVLFKKLNPISLFSTGIRYKGERTADNFATIYGYGAAEASLFNKFNNEKMHDKDIVMGQFDKFPILPTLFHLVEMPALIILTAFDEHPDEIYRCKDQLALLKREVKKEDLDPKMRAVLLSDIKQCEIQIDQLIDTTKGIKDPYLAKHLYNKVLSHFNGGLKELLLDDKKKFDRYDDQYNKLNSKF